MGAVVYEGGKLAVLSESNTWQGVGGSYLVVMPSEEPHLPTTYR